MGKALIPAEGIRDARQRVAKMRGEQPVVLILGMDAFAGIDRWHRAEDLIALAHIVVALRPQSTLPRDGLGAKLLRERRTGDAARLAAAPAGFVLVSDNTQLDLSSSAVRALVAAGRDPRYLMPEAARRIILGTGSYARPGETKE